MSQKSQNPEDRFRRQQKRQEDHRKKLPGEDEEALPPPAETIHSEQKPGRNDPCTCGSGKKYKQCCGKP